MKTYKIVRSFLNEDYPSRVIQRGLTLEEAQEWCRDPETSHRTCVKEKNVLRTKLYGPWFDGYDPE
jgi:hypothetical protein